MVIQNSVVANGLCTGCGACVDLCPYQKNYRDKTVVLFPCDREDGRCLQFCPRYDTDLDALRNALFAPEDLTPEIGAIKAFYVTRATDPEIRTKAQHGGTVTALVKLAIEEKLIDAAVMSGQDTKSTLLPQGVGVDSAADVADYSKSRFVATPTIAQFNRLAKTGVEKIGVVATPCQATALAKMRLKKFSENTNNIDRLKLVIGLFCGWAFSWKELCEVLKRHVELDQIVAMDIPPSKYHCLEVQTADKNVTISLDEIRSCVRESCDYCADMTAEFSDISVGSARLEEGWQEAKNWNQVVVRTEAGMNLMALARERKILEFREVPENNLGNLKRASMGKKRTAVKNLVAKSGNAQDLVYLHAGDSVLCDLIPR